MVMLKPLGTSFNSVKISDQLDGRIQQALRFGGDPSEIAERFNLPLVAILGIEKNMTWSDESSQDKNKPDNQSGVLQKKKIGRPKGSKTKKKLNAMALPPVALEKEIASIRQSIHRSPMKASDVPQPMSLLAGEVTKLRQKVKIMRKLIITLLQED